MNRPAWATCLDEAELWGGWALNYDSAVSLAHLLDEHRPRRTFESGSGSTTLLFSQYADAYDDSNPHHLAFESGPQYAQKTLELLNRYGTGSRTKITQSAVLPTQQGPWYAAPDPQGVDFALIDGPRQQDGGRHAALFHLHTAQEAVIVLDDTDRPDEQAVLAAWKRHFGLDFSPLPNTTGSASYTILGRS